jgi:hypothetical protein
LVDHGLTVLKKIHECLRRKPSSYGAFRIISFSPKKKIYREPSSYDAFYIIFFFSPPSLIRPSSYDAFYIIFFFYQVDRVVQFFERHFFFSFERDFFFLGGPGRAVLERQRRKPSSNDAEQIPARSDVC